MSSQTGFSCPKLEVVVSAILENMLIQQEEAIHVMLEKVWRAASEDKSSNLPDHLMAG